MRLYLDFIRSIEYRKYLTLCTTKFLWKVTREVMAQCNWISITTTFCYAPGLLKNFEIALICRRTCGSFVLIIQFIKNKHYRSLRNWYRSDWKFHTILRESVLYKSSNFFISNGSRFPRIFLINWKFINVRFIHKSMGANNLMCQCLI